MDNQQIYENAFRATEIRWPNFKIHVSFAVTFILFILCDFIRSSSLCEHKHELNSCENDINKQILICAFISTIENWFDEWRPSNQQNFFESGNKNDLQFQWNLNHRLTKTYCKHLISVINGSRIIFRRSRLSWINHR